MSESAARIVPIAELLADPELVAVADAFVRTEWVSVEPPTWNTLAERMAAVTRRSGRKEAESQAWMVLAAAKRFIEMQRAMTRVRTEQEEKDLG